jgi:hypothetical protein
MFIKKNDNRCSLKQEKNMALMTVSGIDSVSSAVKLMEEILNQAQEEEKIRGEEMEKNR